MSGSLYAKPLKTDELDKAFALIQLAFDGVTLERWHRHVEQSADPTNEDAGWIAIEDNNSYIHGLLAYRVESDLMCGRAFVAYDIILAGVALNQASACAVDGLSQMAWRMGCDAIHVVLPGFDEDSLDRGLVSMKASLLQMGFTDHGNRLCFHRTGHCRR